MAKIKRCVDVSTWRLCMGCGACAWSCPNEAVVLENIADRGIRPFIDESKCEQCGACVAACPGVSLEHGGFDDSVLQDCKQGWGPVLKIYDGCAADNDIRYAASSGGAATALALFALDTEQVGQVLHIKADPEAPFDNLPVFSTTREDLMGTTGSRYAPASPCEAFGGITAFDGDSLFIGKPCDIAALRKAQRIDPELKRKVKAAVSIFCAGTPTLNGTLSVVNALGVKDASDVDSFSYRGNGWPGEMTAVCSDGERYTMPYIDAWGGILTKHGQLRCRLCPDPTGEFADVSCGDAWYRSTEGDAGRSLIVVRTRVGMELVKQAIDAGYLIAEEVDSDVLPRSQQSVYEKRCNLWGRLFALKMLRIPAPVYKGFSLRECWKELSLKDKIKAVAGTFKRIALRKWFVRERYAEEGECRG